MERQKEIKCEIVDLRRETLENCDRTVEWLIILPNEEWTSCDNHFRFKSEAENKGFDKAVKYKRFETKKES